VKLIVRTLEQAAIATHALKAAGSKKFLIDPLASPHSAAVVRFPSVLLSLSLSMLLDLLTFSCRREQGATLANFNWNLKTTSAAKAKLEPVDIGLLGEGVQASLESEKGADGRIPLDWETGKIYGEAQNL